MAAHPISDISIEKTDLGEPTDGSSGSRSFFTTERLLTSVVGRKDRSVAIPSGRESTPSPLSQNDENLLTKQETHVTMIKKGSIIMKNKYHSRFIAIFVVVSMLLTCMIMPATATASTESLNPAVNIVASDDLLTDDELLPTIE